MDEAPPDPTFAKDVASGLGSDDKHLPPKWLYDAEGSKLFEKITQLPEYYLTQAERSIFESHGLDIVDGCPTPLRLVELGAGSAEKTRLLIDAILHQQERATYAPVDISRKALEMAEERFAQDEGVIVEPVQGTFIEGLETMDPQGEQARLIALIGSSIGNMPMPDQRDLLSSIRTTMRPQDRLLLGTDLAKDASILLPAYDDEQGVTDAFTLNILRRINRELGGTFDLDAFRHDASFEEAKSAVVIHIESLQDQTVTIHDLGMTVRFRQGERIHIEDSYKYTPAMLADLFDAAHLERLETFHDDEGWFGAHLLERGQP